MALSAPTHCWWKTAIRRKFLMIRDTPPQWKPPKNLIKTKENLKKKSVLSAAAHWKPPKDFFWERNPKLSQPTVTGSNWQHGHEHGSTFFTTLLDSQKQQRLMKILRDVHKPWRAGHVGIRCSFSGTTVNFFELSTYTLCAILSWRPGLSLGFRCWRSDVTHLGHPRHEVDSFSVARSRTCWHNVARWNHLSGALWVKWYSVTCESLNSWEFSRIFLKFHFSISNHFYFTFTSRFPVISI